MHKKGLLIALVFLLSGLVIAQSNGTNNSNSVINSNANVIDKAYQCLQTQVNNKDQSSISLQEAIFGILALGSNQKLNAVIDSKIIGGNHWGESSNQIKDTSQVLLAHNRIGKNTDSVEAWIISNKRTATELTWYLEIDIDNHEASSCTISSNAEQRTINVNEDMTLSGNPGSCLTIAAGGFWLRISNTCIDRNFTVSCDKDFTTSTLYQRTGSSTVFVSPVAHSTSALGATVESVNSKCFSTATSGCDYEGTLWAALALDKSGNDISDYLPYLLALSESNLRFLPSSFLHILTDGQDQYSQLVQSQKENKYWQAPSTPYNRYYDTALALLSLQGVNSAEESSAKNYFESIVTPEGCWNNNNIRDTGFLLYAGWPRLVSGGSGGSGSGQPETCEQAGETCTSLFACKELGGTQLENYRCSGTRVCCSESPVVLSCFEQNGVLCSSGEICSGTEVASTDGSCCLATCDAPSQENECEAAGGSCYPSCNAEEEPMSLSCIDSSQVCCKTVTTTTTNDSNWTLWIILLSILIIIVVIAILMRDRLKMMLFKSRNRPGSQPQGPPSGRPPFPPFRGSIPYPRAQPRIVNPPQMRRPIQGGDKEMEETMRKLREMSK